MFTVRFLCNQTFIIHYSCKKKCLHYFIFQIMEDTIRNKRNIIKKHYYFFRFISNDDSKKVIMINITNEIIVKASKKLFD